MRPIVGADNDSNCGVRDHSLNAAMATQVRTGDSYGSECCNSRYEPTRWYHPPIVSLALLPASAVIALTRCLVSVSTSNATMLL
jgi:hypothetical protein